MTVISQDSSAMSTVNTSVLASLDRKPYDEPRESIFSKCVDNIYFPPYLVRLIHIISHCLWSLVFRNSGLDDLLTRGGSSKSSRDSDWDMLTELNTTSKSSVSSFGAPISSSSSYGSSSSNKLTSSSSYGSSSTKGAAPASAGSGGEAQKKFGAAKAISSDQFFQDSGSADVSHIVKLSVALYLEDSCLLFNRVVQYERRANLSRFEGSSGISSADYFGTGGNSSRSRNAAGPSYNIQVN